MAELSSVRLRTKWLWVRITFLSLKKGVFTFLVEGTFQGRVESSSPKFCGGLLIKEAGEVGRGGQSDRFIYFWGGREGAR